MQYCFNKLWLILTGTYLLLLMIDVKAQSTPCTVEITYNKTTSLVFPAVITSVDRGSRDVLVQKAKGVDNILQVKAARKDFPETNLTVITADGMVHQFTVLYSKEPKQLVQEVNTKQGDDGMEPVPLIFKSSITEADMERLSKEIVSMKRGTRFISTDKHKLKLSLYGIYIHENVIFYRVNIQNRSNIKYDVNLLRFYVQDHVKVKRTASQEVEMKPLYIYGENRTIRGKEAVDVVYALEKFTTPDSKRLIIEMFEQNGGRNLSLSIRNRTIVNAKLLHTN